MYREDVTTSWLYWYLVVLPLALPPLLVAGLVCYPLGCAVGYAWWSIRQCICQVAVGFEQGCTETRYEKPLPEGCRRGGLL